MAAFMSRISFSRKPNSKVYNHNPGGSGFYSKNPCDPDSELEPETNRRSPKTLFEPASNQLHRKSSLSNGSGYSGSSYGRKTYKDNFCESGAYVNQSVTDMDSYAVNKAEETTQTINGCLKVVEEMREGSSRILINLHQQSEQIMRTHQTVASIDHNLRRGEKLLGSLGGLFSKKWRPKKTRKIKGPLFCLLARDVSFSRRDHHMEQRQKIGLTPPRSQWNPRRLHSEPSSAFGRVEMEKAKQEDALSDLGDLLGKLKAMAVDMGSEIDRQNKALDNVQEDVDELNVRMKGANIRARHLLRR